MLLTKFQWRPGIRKRQCPECWGTMTKDPLGIIHFAHSIHFLDTRKIPEDPIGDPQVNLLEGDRSMPGSTSNQSTGQIRPIVMVNSPRHDCLLRPVGGRYAWIASQAELLDNRGSLTRVHHIVHQISTGMILNSSASQKPSKTKQSITRQSSSYSEHYKAKLLLRTLQSRTLQGNPGSNSYSLWHIWRSLWCMLHFLYGPKEEWRLDSHIGPHFFQQVHQVEMFRMETLRPMTEALQPEEYLTCTSTSQSSRHMIFFTVLCRKDPSTIQSPPVQTLYWPKHFFKDLDQSSCFFKGTRHPHPPLLKQFVDQIELQDQITETTIRCLQAHRFLIDLLKSYLESVQWLEHLGVMIDTTTNCLFLTEKKSRKMKEILESIFRRIE